MLEEALRVAQEGGVMGPLLAQTNLNLGIVYVGGLSDNDGGVKYFMDAICADPSVQLDPLTSTPDVQSVFQVAGQRVQQMGCPQGGGPMIVFVTGATGGIGQAIARRLHRAGAALVLNALMGEQQRPQQVSSGLLQGLRSRLPVLALAGTGLWVKARSRRTPTS